MMPLMAGMRVVEKTTKPRAWLLKLVLAGLLLLQVAGCAAAQEEEPAATTAPPRPVIARIEPLGLVTFSTGYQFADTEVGGLSALAYDSVQDHYYILSDDRSLVDPARFYTIAIDLADGSLDDGDVTFQAVTFLHDDDGAFFAERAIDPEGLVLVGADQLVISTEGDAEENPPIDPAIFIFNLDGRQTGRLPVPDKFLPDGAETYGVRDNNAFESLTTDTNRLYTAAESALHQDGPVATLDEGSPARILEYDLATQQPGREFVYPLSPIPAAAIRLDAAADNGLVELIALDETGSFLALERSYAVGVGNTVRLFQFSLADATDVSGFDLLPETYTPVEKMLLADFAQELGIDPDNLEGMALGPTLPDGRRVLIVVSDNNFNRSQTTQIIALALDFGTLPPPDN